MKKIITFAALLLATVSVSAKSFEGYVHYNMKSGRDSMKMSYAIKDDRLRMEMAAKGGYQSIGLFDPAAGDVKILMPQQKMYMAFPYTGEVVAKAAPKNLDFEETGETMEIAGYECAQFVVREKKETYEFWATEELGRYISFMDVQKSKGKAPAWAKEMMDRNLFPLLIIMKDRRGREKMRMEAIGVEKTSLDEELFEIPEDYSAFSIPGLGGLLKGLGQ